MARNSELEHLIFSQMAMEYQLCNSLSSVPAYYKKLLQNDNRFYEQWTFSDLKKYRERQERINDFQESEESKEIRRQQAKVWLDDKNQLAIVDDLNEFGSKFSFYFYLFLLLSIFFVK